MTRGFRYYHGEEPYPRAGIQSRTRYVKTGEKRPPLRGEFYLSGALPTVWRAPNDLGDSFHIMRVATRDETHCKCCGQLLPITE